MRVISSLVQLRPEMKPSSVMTDFESPLFSAFSDTFDNVTLRGCLFHFSQCIWRKINTLPDIREMYCNDPDFSLQLRQILALAFIPPADVVDKFNELMRLPFYVENEGILQPLMDYYEDVWIGRPNRQGARRNPKFALEHWNQYNATIQNLPKTNNAVEGWHSAFSASLAKHPNIWAFIVAIQNENNLSMIKLSHAMRGEDVKQKKKYQTVNSRIKNIVQEYEKRSLSDYVLGISVSLEMQV